MTWNAAESVWQITVAVATSATQLDVVFHNGAGSWDNNGGADWHFAVQGGGGPEFEMDGALDAAAQQIATNGGVHLWAALQGNVLYVATEDAGEGNDHFIYLALTPGPLQPANWAKAGQIAAWGAYLADENSNDYESWFDATGSREASTGANGGVLEGTLHLAEEFGALPAEIWLAVGVYASADGGALVPSKQVPASINGNGNIDAAEYILVDLLALGGGDTPCPGDADGDGTVGNGDLQALLDAWAAVSPDPRYDASVDFDEDGQISNGDLQVMLDHWACD
jgi:hypothetical protein